MIKAGVLIDDRYEIQSVLGTGSFGYVYKAWHKLLDRPVAVKVMNSVVMEESDGLARFEREAKAMSALHHKNIVGFHGFGIWDHAPYMVMEFLEGTSVQKVLASKQPMHQSRALELMIQLCDALSSAHQAGIVHRDLKPSNLMLVEAEGRETLKIIDFGLAKLMPGYGIAAQRLTETGYAVGTCHYMSPEQCVGNSQVDHRTDIYAAGCILYESLVGVPPFEAEDSVAVMFQHVNAPVPRLSASINTDTQTHALQAVIDKAMAKEVEERYQTAEDMLKDLRAIAVGNTRAHALVQMAKTARPKGTAVYEKRDLKKLLPGVIALAVTSAIGIGALLWHEKHSESADTPVQAINVYDELSRDTARFGHGATKEERERMVDMMNKAIDLNKHDHTLTDRQLYQMIREQEWNMFALGRVDDGIRLCQRAIDLAPPDVDRYVDYEHLERGLELKGATAHALDVLRRVSSETWIGPSQRKKINISLARLALRRGDYAAAHTYINQVPEVDVPGSQTGYYWEVRGNLAFLEHNYQEARRLYELGLTSTGSGDEVLFQTGLARTALAAHDSSQYAQMRTNLDRLWQTPQGKFFLSLGLLDGALAGRLHENAALEKIAQEVLTTQATIGEMRALTYADHEQFQQAMKAAGYNQLLEQINKKYGWS